MITAGVDEAGRGPLIGSVVAACVILDPKNPIVGLADSKTLTAKKRQNLFIEIQDKALAYAYAEATAEEIDSINILQASLLAMQRSIEQVAKILAPDQILVDGSFCPKICLPSKIIAIVKGDSKVAEISAASIVAKVVRDKMMEELDMQHPEYGFAKHKGYPTKAHLLAIHRLGILPQHRRTFGPIKEHSG
jgi:ribonuclease HII